MVNEQIQIDKKLSDYYKSLADRGIPTLQEDDNIRLLAGNSTNLDTNLRNEFMNKMGKYINNPTQLEQIYTKLDTTQGMVNELVHNWDLYEPDIRRYRGQYLSDVIFIDKLVNMLLKNVNLKYPYSFNSSTVPSGNATNATQDNANNQRAGFDKLDSKDNSDKIEFILDTIGNQRHSNKTFEKASVVFQHFNNLMGTSMDNIEQMKKLLYRASDLKRNQQQFDAFYNWCVATHDGIGYKINIPFDKNTSSFRSALIGDTVNKYHEILDMVKHDNGNHDEIYRTFQSALKNFGITFGGEHSKAGKLENKLYETPNETIVEINIKAIASLKYIRDQQIEDANYPPPPPKKYHIPML
jgi:hypothetical protein